MRKVLEANQYVRFLGIETIDLREGACILLPAGGTKYVYCEAEKLCIGGHIAVFDVRMKDEDS